MKRLFLLPALLCLALTAHAQVSETQAGASLNLEQKTLLRCSATFALVAAEQAKGVTSAQSYPSLEGRGREFFVLAGAQLMDELELGRDQIERMFGEEVERLQAESSAVADPWTYVDMLMQPCMLALEASGL